MDAGRRSDPATGKARTTVERTSERELVVTRTIDGPAHIVFEAWSKPELFQRWWAPKSCGVSLISYEADVRTGGAYRLLMGHPSSEEPMAFFGRYIEVTPHSRLVWTNDEGGEGGAVTTVTFEEKDGATRAVVHELYPSKEALDDAMASGSTSGWGEQFEQLDDLIVILEEGLKAMGEVRVRGFAVSIDGFGAGPDQGLEHPMGKGGRELHKWFFPTRTFRSMIGQDGGTDDRFARATAEGFGAFILGRNMFGPAGDDWGGPDWKGWWGDNPPYHAPTFILTHHARAPIVMEGGTTFHFVTGGIEAALAQAKAAAGDLDVKIAGGVSTVRQYLLAGAIDEMHLAVSPIVLGRGEPLFAGIDLPGLGYRVMETIPTELATHIVLTR